MTDLQRERSGPAFRVLPRKPRIWFVDGVFEEAALLRDRVRALRLRTSAGVLADFGSDYGHYHRAYLLRLYGYRVLVVALAEAAALATRGWTWPVWALLVPMCLVVGSVQGVAEITALALAPFYGRFWWIPLVAVLAGSLYVKGVEPVRVAREALLPRRPICLLPWRERLFLSRAGLWFTVGMAFDLTEAGFPQRAAKDLSAVLDALSTQTPECRAMLLVTQAAIAYERDDHAKALLLAESARQAAARSSPGPRAWIALGLSRLFAELGDRPAALAYASDAVARAPRQARRLRLDSLLQVGSMAERTGDPEAATDALYRARVLSVQHRDVLGLITTEVMLLRTLDISHQTRTEVMDWLVDLVRGEYKRPVAIPRGVEGAVESLAAEFAKDRGDLRSAADHFARATIAFGKEHNVVQYALAVARLAEVLDEAGDQPMAEDGITHQEQRADTLDFALQAIEKFQDVRYTLPTSQWRQSWARAQARTYDLALRMAVENGDHEHAAALIELSKSQAVAIADDQADTARRSIFDSLLEARASTVVANLQKRGTETSGSDALRALVNADTVHVAAPPVVAGTPALPGAEPRGVHVDEVIQAFAGPEAVYLTSAVTGRHYFWAFRTPDGGWTSGMADISEGSTAFDSIDRLLAALPVRRPHETTTDYWYRLAGSPLVRNNDARARADESALMRQAGAVLVPASLERVLRRREETGRTKLVVSMPGTLSAVPVAFLGVSDSSDTRLVEIADVQILPSIELASHLLSRQPAEQATTWPLRAAGAFNDDEWAPNVSAPPWAPVVIDGRLAPSERKKQLRSTILSSHGTAATIYLSGHLTSAHEAGSANPLQSGLSLACGDTTLTADEAHLTVADLLRAAAHPAPPLPDRIVLLACSTLGVAVGGAATDETTASQPTPAKWPLAGEWVGFSSACLLAGARVVICTHFDQVDAAATELDHQITRMTETADDPVHGLSEIIRTQLTVWREGRSGHSLTMMCYAVVSV